MLLTCPNGHENPDGQHFCRECGAAITPAERTGPSAEGEPTERAAIHWEAPEPAAGPPEQVPGPPTRTAAPTAALTAARGGRKTTATLES
jgi:hypothetical protein